MRVESSEMKVNKFEQVFSDDIGSRGEVGGWSDVGGGCSSPGVMPRGLPYRVTYPIMHVM